MSYIKNKNIELLPTVELENVLHHNEVMVNTLSSFPGFIGKVLPAFVGLTTAPSPTTMTSGRLWGIHFILKETTIITGVKYGVFTAGVYTASDQNGVSLYSDTAGVLTKVSGGEILDENFWKTPGLNTKPFSTPITLSAGSYKLCFLWCSSATTTAPSLWNFSTVYNGNFSLVVGNSEKLSASVSGYTAFPTSAFTAGSLGSNQSVTPMFWLY